MQPLLQWQINKYSECVFIDSGTQCEAHKPYCHLWRAWLYNIFLHNLINSTTSEKKKYIKLHFDFLYKSVWSISHSKKKSAIYAQKCILIFMYSTRYSSQIPMTLQFSLQIFKNTHYQISWKSVQWEPSCSMRTDRQAETDTRRKQALVAIFRTRLKNGASKYNTYTSTHTPAH